MGIKEVLAANERKDLLRFLTCGSVDDGKSTLIGRLLNDSKQVYEDHLQSLEKDSKKVGSAGEKIDYSLLLDGLKAEREQGITIDVAYRYFSTPRRKFIIADCPGHVQYTRNMVTGGSTCSLAVVLIDAEKGVLEQTKRHSFIVSLLNMPHVVVAVNKMDLVGFSEERFQEIRREYTEFATRLSVKILSFVPLSALEGDNVVDKSDRTPWYPGMSMLEHLERVHVASDRNLVDLRWPIQYVLRQDSKFRGFSGTIASGILRKGDEVEILPSRKQTKIAELVSYDGPVEEAFPPMAITARFTDEVDVSRGDMVVKQGNQPRVESEIEAVLVWMDEAPMVRSRPYKIKHATSETKAEFSELRYRFDINTLHREDADALKLNEIGRVRVSLASPIPFDPYQRNRTTGSFIVIDPISNGTVAAGMIVDRNTPDRSKSQAGARHSILRPKNSLVTKAERRERLGHDAATIWLTGLPKAGKSTIAFALERQLFDRNRLVHVLDGENLRLGISDNLGFQALERSEAVRRAAHVAKLCNNAGLVTIVALVSPFQADREAAKAIIGQERFYEVYLSAPADACAERDTDRLYEKAKSGEIPNFTGVTAPYEKPPTPALELPTHEIEVDESVSRILSLLS